MKTPAIAEHALVVLYGAVADWCYIPEPIGSYTVKKSGKKAIWVFDNQSGKDVTVVLSDWKDKATGKPASPFVQPPPYIIFVPAKKKARLVLDMRDDAPVTTYKYLIEVTYLHGGDTRTWRSTDPDLIIDGSAEPPPEKPKKPARKPAPKPVRETRPSARGKKRAAKKR